MRDERLVHLFFRLLPDFDRLIIAVFVAHAAALIELFDLEYVRVRLFEYLVLLRGDVHIEHARRDGAHGGILIALVLDLVEHDRGLGRALVLEAGVDYAREHALAHGHVAALAAAVPLGAQELFSLLARQAHFVRLTVGSLLVPVYFEIELLLGSVPRHELQILRDRLVEDYASRRGLYDLAHGDAVYLLAHAHMYHGLQIYLSQLISLFRLVAVAEESALAARALLDDGQVIAAHDHVLSGRDDRLTVGELEYVIGGEHEESRLRPRLDRKGNVHRHLVAVEVRVERAAGERMQLDRPALDEHGLERLNAQTVQRGRAVEQHGMIFDHFFEDVPDLALLRFFYDTLGSLDVLADAVVHQTLDHERLEQFQRHLLGDTALIHFQFGTDDDDRTSGIVHALTQKVLTETSLLTFEQTGERFELAVARARDRLAAPAVVDERVHSLLKHALFVADYDVGRA